MTVTATDDGIIPRAGQVIVYINIIRHLGTPLLTPDPCAFSVNENAQVGSQLYTLTASDSNNAVSGFSVYMSWAVGWGYFSTCVCVLALVFLSVGGG
jgi:hypothetical protein